MAPSIVFANPKATIEKTLQQGLWGKRWKISSALVSDLLKGAIHTRVDAQTNEEKKQQKLSFAIAGLHPANCQKALRKLSLYEQFEDFLPLVKKSLYDEQKKRMQLHLAAPILPFKMVLIIDVDRISKVGNYPYSFPTGFFPGLKGTVRIIEVNNRCFFSTDADWSGKESKLSSWIIETAAPFLSKTSMEKLFRISRF